MIVEAQMDLTTQSFLSRRMYVYGETYTDIQNSGQSSTITVMRMITVLGVLQVSGSAE